LRRNGTSIARSARPGSIQMPRDGLNDEAADHKQDAGRNAAISSRRRFRSCAPAWRQGQLAPAAAVELLVELRLSLAHAAETHAREDEFPKTRTSP
jgi:hypothetical protein